LLCFFEAFSFFLGSEVVYYVVVDASLDVCTVKLSRFVLYNRLQDLGSGNRTLTSWSVLLSFSSDLVREVVRAAR